MRAGIKALVAVALVAGWLWLVLSPSAPDIARISAELVPALVRRAGNLGPLAVILLMALAVVASPVPSAPIALAAGAAYGHFAGTIYVAIGSGLGAMLAFLIARYLGRDMVERWLGRRIETGLLGSQNALTLAVFASRLLPFVSFDAISYGAGLSRLHLWRFGIATLAGILPASFVLAHFGAAAMTGEFGMAEWLATGLGLVSAAPLLWLALRRKPARPNTNPNTNPNTK